MDSLIYRLSNVSCWCTSQVDVSPRIAGYWSVVNSWQEFCHQRLLMIQAKAQQQIQELLMPYIQVCTQGNWILHP